jgi:hypothetical protein
MISKLGDPLKAEEYSALLLNFSVESPQLEQRLGRDTTHSFSAGQDQVKQIDKFTLLDRCHPWFVWIPCLDQVSLHLPYE